MKGTEAFTSGPTALSVSALCKSAARGRNRGQGEEKSKIVCVCVCVSKDVCVKAMENMIAGRDVRSL